MSTISSPPGHQLPEEAIGVLSSDGFIDPTESAKAFVDDATAIDHERVAEMYRLMATTRRIDEEGVNLQRQGHTIGRPRSSSGRSRHRTGRPRLDFPDLPRTCHGPRSRHPR